MKNLKLFKEMQNRKVEEGTTLEDKIDDIADPKNKKKKNKD